MYRVLIADDEGIVRDSLRFIIDKNFPDQCQIETAKSGRDVIEVAEHFRPDIAFMDILMPGINGIDAIREIQQTNPNVEFIVLSACDRFDYAKEAVTLGVMEYMNKPFNNDSIVEVLTKAMKLIDAHRQKRSDDLLIKEKLETVMPIIENGFVYALMFQDRLEDDISSYTGLLEMEADYGCMLVLALGDEQQGHHMTNAVGAGLRAQSSYSRVCELVKNTFPTAIVGSLLSNKIPVFLPMADSRVSYEERIAMIDVCRELARRLRQTTELTFRIGIGGVCLLSSCRDSYDGALRALSTSSGSVAHVNDLPVGCRYDEEYPIDLELQLFEALKKGAAEECNRLAGEFFDWMIASYGEEDINVKLKILEFVLWAEHEDYQDGGNTYHFTSRANYMPLVYEAKKNSDLRPWFVERFETSSRHMLNKEEDHENRLVAKAVEYIRENFQKDLSLDDVSRQLDISPYYFSKLFKEETGSNFVKYVNDIRIERSKELLNDPDLSMKEICIQVGYSDPNYFSRIFKKSTGVSPTEYRGGC